jgi:hypothetical protein
VLALVVDSEALTLVLVYRSWLIKKILLTPSKIASLYLSEQEKGIGTDSGELSTLQHDPDRINNTQAHQKRLYQNR